MTRPHARGAVPEISVIMPVYNCAEYIDESLSSIFAQSFTNYEVIVVNDGSTDTAALERALAPHRDRIVYIQQENRGPSAARNVGIAAARADVIAFLDADDRFEPDYLEAQLQVLRSDPTLDVVYPDAVFFGETPDAGRRFTELNPSDTGVTFESLITGECTVLVHATARREAIRRVGMFDEALRVSEDFDLWLRIVKSGGRIAHHPRVLVRFRRREGSLSSSGVRMCAGMLRVFEKVTRTMELTDGEAKALEAATVSTRAWLHLHQGMRDFIRREWDGALRGIAEANTHFKMWKLTAATAALRIAPEIALSLYLLRERRLQRPSGRR
jgi:glycosyltransferase involved in cell wall biosynthesis